MSLISQLPLAAIGLPVRNVATSKRFYKDVIGLRVIEESDSHVHFDLGTVRLFLKAKDAVGAVPAPVAKGDHVQGHAPSPSALTADGQQHLVFVVENQIEAVYSDLAKRGVKLKPKKIVEDAEGKAVWFDDPDGHVIYLWQPPKRESKNYKDVEALVAHYESIARALADLREEDAA
jgi:catechol 2,3-dioxygenase-like lactoylglutathione lyase family enzyme